MERKRKFNIRDSADSATSSNSYSGLSMFKKSKQNKTEQVTMNNNTTETTQQKNESSKPANDSRANTSRDVKKPNKPYVSQLMMSREDPFKLPPIEKKPLKVSTNTNCIFVNPVQRGNALLKHIINVPYEYKEIIPDYEIGETACAFYLSLRYHNLNPDYIHTRLKQLGSRYNLRVLLVHVDIINSKSSLSELAKLCMMADLTFILAWSLEEAGRYLETYKSYEYKSADILKEPVEKDFMKQMHSVLTSVKSINKTDVITLYSAFGSFKNIVHAKEEEFNLCPGFGAQKASRLSTVIRKPFKRAHVQTIKTVPNASEKEKADDKDTKASPVKSYIESSQIVKPSEVRAQENKVAENDELVYECENKGDNDNIEPYENLRNTLASAKEKLNLKPVPSGVSKNENPVAVENVKQTNQSSEKVSVYTKTTNSLSFREKVRQTKEQRERKESDKNTAASSKSTSKVTASQATTKQKLPKLKTKTSISMQAYVPNKTRIAHSSNSQNKISLPSSKTESTTKSSSSSTSKIMTPMISPTVAQQKTFEISQEEYEDLLADDDDDDDTLC